ncbi:hypothetical protein [Acinetobacter sp.]|uniref:hypothetical protein n=1 Tax=Acinetobacter sp. TaxID=472 RepID=UPI00333EB3C7
MTTEAKKCKTSAPFPLNYSTWNARQLATKYDIQNTIPNIPNHLCDYISFQYGFLRQSIDFAKYYYEFWQKTNRHFTKKKYPFDLIDEKFADWMNERSTRSE